MASALAPTAVGRNNSPASSTHVTPCNDLSSESTGCSEESSPHSDPHVGLSSRERPKVDVAEVELTSFPLSNSPDVEGEKDTSSLEDGESRKGSAAPLNPVALSPLQSALRSVITEDVKPLVRCLCCTVLRRTKKRLICCSIMWAILVTLGLTLYFLYPRVPDMREKSVVTKSFDIYQPPGAEPSFHLDSVITYDVASENYVAFYIDSLSASVSIEYNGSSGKVGTIWQGRWEFPPRQKSEYLILARFFGSAETDAGMQLLVDACASDDHSAHVAIRGKAVAEYLQVRQDVAIKFAKSLDCRVFPNAPPP